MPTTQCVPSDLLCRLNQYSNLILVLVTIAYVILTWRMVTEMRRARENESEPQLITTLIPLGPISIKLRIQNVGLGPALQIEAKIRLQPDSGETPVWRQPVLISGAFEDFLLPDKSTGQIPAFKQVASQYDKLVIDLKWSNVYGREHRTTHEIDLKEQLQGWYSAHRLIQPTDIPNQLAAIQNELKEIRKELEKTNKSREQAEIELLLRKRLNPFYRFRDWLYNQFK